MSIIQNFMNIWNIQNERIEEQINGPVSLLNLIKNAELLPHQTSGVRWLIKLYFTGRNAILADEMGLGKTIQSLALLSFSIQNTSKKVKYLIIAPLPLLENWGNQLQNFLPEVKYIKLTGQQKSRLKFKQCMQNIQGNIQVLLLSFSFILTHGKLLSNSKYHFELVFVDQAHKCKNAQSITSKAILSITCHMKILLTGSPFENSITQTNGLLEIIQPQILKGEQLSKLTTEQYKQVLNFFMMRRLKHQVTNNIPKKYQKIIYLKLTDIQEEIYKQINTKKKEVLSETQNTSFQIQQYVKICDHPYLFSQVIDLDERLILCSTKMIQLDKILEMHLKKNEKIVIFTQFLKMCQLISNFCTLKNYKNAVYNGDYSVNQKKIILEQFKFDENQKILIMTTRSGGVGLNLIEANVVILYDSSWNPQIDRQAIDRCHRIGQTKEVFIYRLICQGTVEERIINNQSIKRNLQAQYLQIVNNQVEYIKEGQIKNQLFEMLGKDWGSKQKQSATKILDQRLRKKIRTDAYIQNEQEDI